ncbi:hypothetical protein VI817_009929 [Penicillium citrinum]|nr:hypothetical protein VI817_009929 [Penicillium citrinum]
MARIDVEKVIEELTLGEKVALTAGQYYKSYIYFLLLVLPCDVFYSFVHCAQSSDSLGCLIRYWPVVSPF